MKYEPKILIGIVFFNELGKTKGLLNNLKKLTLPYTYQIIFVNDGSTDNSFFEINNFLNKNKIIKAKVINNSKNKGVGYSIRKVIRYGLDNDFDICVIMAGNGKDNPIEIPKIVKPIIEKNYDYVQGSRFLEGGSFKNLPYLRRTLIKGFTLMFHIFTGSKLADASNGFRSYKLSIFKNKEINLDQKWLDRYELETYLHYKVITLGYKIKEVGVSKDYLPNVKNYSKIRPFIDWWKMIRPVFLLKFGLKN